MQRRAQGDVHQRCILAIEYGLTRSDAHAQTDDAGRLVRCRRHGAKILLG